MEVSPLRGTTQKMSRLRKVIAERAVASMQATAQLTTVVEVDVTKLSALRDRMKGEFQQKTGDKLSFLPFFAIAAIEGLKAYPIINSTVEGDEIVYPAHENVSIAVDTERGLLTPVVKDAGDKNIAQLAREIADLAARTRDNKLKPDELAGGTFTLTNTGSRGALFDTPIVFLPQSAILGLGAVVKKPGVVSVDGKDAISVRSYLPGSVVRPPHHRRRRRRPLPGHGQGPSRGGAVRGRPRDLIPPPAPAHDGWSATVLTARTSHRSFWRTSVTYCVTSALSSETTATPPKSSINEICPAAAIGSRGSRGNDEFSS